MGFSGFLNWLNKAWVFCFEKFKNFKAEITAFVLYLILSLIATWPLVLNFSTEVYGKHFYYFGDAIATLYGVWWNSYAISHGLSVLNNTMISLSSGGSYSVLWYPYISFLAFFLHFFGNTVFVYNFIMISSIPLSAIAMFLLVKHFTKSNVSSFISGLIFSFIPYHFLRIQMHMTLAQMQWMPLYILFLFKLDEKPNYQNAVLAGFFLALNFLTDFYYAAFMLVATIVFIAAKIIYKAYLRDFKINIKSFKFFVVSILVFLLIFTVLDYPLISTYFTKGPPITRLFLNVESESTASLLYYVLPYYWNPFFGGFIVNNLGGFIDTSANFVEQEIFISYTALILALCFILFWVYSRLAKKSGKPRRKLVFNDFAIFFFILLGFTGVLMSVGPFINILGFQFNNITYYLYQLSPTLRTYIRTAVLFFISVSVLAGMAVAKILDAL
jgi:hypothetical protein